MNRKRIAWIIGCVVAAGNLAGAPARGAALTYHPLTPCRIVDTRFTVPSPNPLAGGEIRAFNAMTGLAAQGGTAAAGGCLVPPTGGSDFRHRAEAIMVNLVAVGAFGPGDLRVFAGSDTVAPLASVINYVGGQTIAVGTTIPLRTDTTGNDFKVQAAVSGTHLVIDVLGYYSRATTTTFTSRLKGILANPGGPATITQFGPITGINTAAAFPGGTTLPVPPQCSVQRFAVVRDSLGVQAGALRVYSLKRDPDTVVIQCTLFNGDFGCVNNARVTLPSGSWHNLFIEAVSLGPVPATEATITFELACD